MNQNKISKRMVQIQFSFRLSEKIAVLDLMVIGMTLQMPLENLR